MKRTKTMQKDGVKTSFCRRWTVALQSLVLVRLGQELGSDTPAARTVHDVLDMIATLAGVFLK